MEASQRRAEPSRELPAWPTVLAVVAHPDDETFGLGAVIDAMVGAGSAVHVLCLTHGEASTLNQGGADLRTARAAELRLASAELAVAGCTLLDYPDAGLAAIRRPSWKRRWPPMRPGIALTVCWSSMTPA